MIDGLVLPVAWDTAVTAKQSGLYHAPRLHAYVVLHGCHGADDVVARSSLLARAFFYMPRRLPQCLGRELLRFPGRCRQARLGC